MVAKNTVESSTERHQDVSTRLTTDPAVLASDSQDFPLVATFGGVLAGGVRSYSHVVQRRS